MDAYILCGGQSLRMGRDKATLIFNEKPLFEHVADSLEKAGFTKIKLVGKRERVIISRFEMIYDNSKEQHPLNGIAAAMKDTQSEHVLIAPCDLPFLTADSILTLLKGQYPCVAIGKHGLQPLLGIYPKSWHSKVIRYVAQSRSVKSFAQSCNAIQLNQSALKNVNYPYDLGAQE